MVKDPTLSPDLLGLYDDTDAVDESTTESTLPEQSPQGCVPRQQNLSLNPQTRKLLNDIYGHLQRATTGFDTYVDNKPEVAIRFQKNAIELQKVVLECLKFTADTTNKGAPIGRSVPENGADGNSINLQAQGEGIAQLGKLLASVPAAAMSGEVIDAKPTEFTAVSEDNSET